MPENFGSLTPKKYCNAGNRIVLDPFSHGRAAKLAPPDVPSVEDGREIAASRLAVLADAISVFGLTARRLSAKHQRNSAAPDFGDQCDASSTAVALGDHSTVSLVAIAAIRVSGITQNSRAQA